MNVGAFFELCSKKLLRWQWWRGLAARRGRHVSRLM
jgi:hypothetical protein